MGGTTVNNYSSEQEDIDRDRLDLDKKQAWAQGQADIIGLDREIAGMEASLAQYNIDIRESTEKIASYDAWLANYGKQYEQETGSKQAQTDALVASGRETYQNFLDAIGYADAMAGATGRASAGSSQAAVTGMIDRKLVEYAGEDRTLDETGGLFGTQLTAANNEMEQLKLDLQFQYAEIAGDANLGIKGKRQIEADTIDDYRQALATTEQSIKDTRGERDKLSAFIEDNFGTGTGDNAAAGTPNKPAGWGSTLIGVLGS
jgi:chromosome segregation ATPase